MTNEIKAGSKLLAEFEGYPTGIEIGSKWLYDRSLCHSSHIVVTVKEVDKGLGNVIFNEKMAYHAYGVQYFDGKVFTPADYSGPTPQNKYHTDYNELMRVWRKFRDLDDLEYRFKPKYKFKKAWLKILIAENPIEDVFKELVEGVKYLNSLKPKS